MTLFSWWLKLIGCFIILYFVIIFSKQCDYRFETVRNVLLESDQKAGITGDFKMHIFVLQITQNERFQLFASWILFWQRYLVVKFPGIRIGKEGVETILLTACRPIILPVYQGHENLIGNMIPGPTSQVSVRMKLNILHSKPYCDLFSFPPPPGGTPK